MLSCVVNVSEGRDPVLLDALVERAGPALLDLHRDPDHHRSVFSLGGEDGACEAAVRSLVEGAVQALDVTGHSGAHPRLGSVDVVPFVPLLPDAPLGALAEAELATACAARDRFCAWAGAALGIPTFCYGPLAQGERTLPELRRLAFSGLSPDCGPTAPHPRAGAICAGARRVLVAYNLVLATGELAVARRCAAALRSVEVRTLAFSVEKGAQVSCNLVAPWSTGPAEVYAALARLAAGEGTEILAAELVGLVPRAVLARIPSEDWERLDLGERKTLEARLSA